VVFAQIGRNSDPLRSPEVIWSTAVLAVALLVGALFVYIADRWRKGNVKRASEPVNELTEFRRMYEYGEITAEEYARLRDKVARRVKTAPTKEPAGATLPGGELLPPADLPGPDQPTPPPDSGKPANPSPPD
jgi:hypothetical protein